MSNHIIETDNLTVYYGQHRGIIDVNLTVEPGEIFGFLGPNGAGKTTTQRVLLDIIRPTKGRAMIFGQDCQQEGVTIRKRVGYLPGELSLYPDMRGRDFLQMLASLHEKDVDTAYRRRLYEMLDLDPNRKMKEYSRGNKQKVGIVAAFMGQPDLLILDEPTGGLDPLVQQTVLELVREAKADGRTVFFSSHILPEVQAVCDRVGIIRQGELVKIDSVESLTRQQFKRLHITFGQEPPTDAFQQEGVEETGREAIPEGCLVKLEVYEGLGHVLETAVDYHIIDLDTPPVTLEEIFLTFYNDDTEEGA